MQDQDMPPGQREPERPDFNIPDNHDQVPDPDADPSVGDDEEPRGVPASIPNPGRESASQAPGQPDGEPS